MTDQPSSPPEKPAPAGDRIAKVLARAGVASRRDAERMIEAGRVRVNGRVIESPALNVTEADRIEVDEQPLAEPEPARLWLYHKPSGLVTTARDEKGRETVFDALPGDMPRVMSVGRLDLNSEGLLLLTNDGEIKRRLELPSTGWLRKYRVRLKGTPKDEDFAPLRDGLVVEGERFQAMDVTLDRQQGANAWATIGIREGRNREIRRAIEAIGFTVNRLIRVSYGPFRLNDLREGEVEEVKQKVLRDQLGLEKNWADPKEKPKRHVKRKPRPDAEARAADVAGAAGTRSGARKPGRGGFGAGKPGEARGDGRFTSGKPSDRKFGASKPGAGKPGGGKFAGKRSGDAEDRGARGGDGKPHGGQSRDASRDNRPGRSFAPKSGPRPTGRGPGPKPKR
ncbi:MAG: pseudouridine synthase [Celeribacter sp.]|jgi:23S rRNA pseudouridine2605 synthase